MARALPVLVCSAQRNGSLSRDPEALLAALRRMLLRLVALRYAQGRGLWGARGLHAAERCDLEALWGQLRGAWRAHPEGMERRFGAWGRLCGALPLCPPLAAGSLAGRGDDLSRLQGAAIDDQAVHQMLQRLLWWRGQLVDHGALEVEHLGAMFEGMQEVRLERLGARGAWALRPSRARRTTGTHYTPRNLAEPIVANALQPALRSLGTKPPPDGLLSVRVCDPAMGSGAFLLAACRRLAVTVVEAWRRRGELNRIESDHGDALSWARRRVARQCLYGVDRDSEAVALARISLWLTVGDPRLQPAAFAATLRHGDSLVGASSAQIAAFDLAPQPDTSMLLPHLGRTLATAARRQRAPWADPHGAAARQGGVPAATASRHDELERAKWLGDLLVGAFFDSPGVRTWRQEQRSRRALVQRWLADGGPPSRSLSRLRERLRARTPAFHWALEFPEAFAGGAAAGLSRGMHVLVGNPPFLGGKRISTEHGDRYARWLQQLHGCSKNTDLAAHFFRRAANLVAADGTIGFIGTNTVAQGATRREGLRKLLREGGFRIHRAERSQPWPGDAAVSVAVVHLARGRCAASIDEPPCLDGRSVRFINSSLRPLPEREPADALAESSRLCFIGCFLRGAGFIISAAEHRELVAHDPRNAACLRPYLGGDEVNSSPRHAHHRYVIDFGARSLEQAAAWPELLAIVRERVKPVRDRLRDGGVDGGHKRRWWQFANVRPELRAAIAPLRRCLVAPRVSKHLSFAFQPTERIFSDQLCVFAVTDYARFAVLQSRVHEAWARLHSSTFGEGLRYTPSDCVETFPFPSRAALGPEGPLQQAGHQLYLQRAGFMRGAGLGLTTTYNLLGDPACRARRLHELRQLHAQLDRAVLDAYGWSDLAVPPFASGGRAGRSGPGQPFETIVIDRLYALNQARRRSAH